MKKILFILFLIFSSLFSFVVLLLCPYVFYFVSIENQFPNQWFTHRQYHSDWLSGKPFALKKQTEELSMDSAKWRNIHLANFELRLPVNHPLFQIRPVINDPEFGDRVQLGVQFLTYNQSELAEVLLQEEQIFERSLEKQKLLSLPLIRGQIEGINLQQVWQDLFSKDLKSDEKVYKILKIPYFELFYNLYLLHLRETYFPENVVSFTFDKNKGMGLLELSSKHEGHREELVLFLVNGKIESYKIKTKLEDSRSELIRFQLLNFVRYLNSDLNKSKQFYELFRDLSYEDKVGQNGMLYLFASWSHNLQDKNFLKEIIRFLERGKGNLQQLHPIYVYAFKKYGAEFVVNKNDPQGGEAGEGGGAEGTGAANADGTSGSTETPADGDGERSPSGAGSSGGSGAIEADEQKQIDANLRKAKDGNNSDEEEDVLTFD